MNRQELIEKTMYIGTSSMEIIIFNTVDEIRAMAESASDEALAEFVSEYEAEYGRIVKYRVEFFHIGSGLREVVEEWHTEEDRYPDLTAVDYMDCAEWELATEEAISGIIVTLFIDEKPMSSVWWHKGDKGEEYDTVFEVER